MFNGLKRRILIKRINKLPSFKHNSRKNRLFNRIPGCSIGNNSILVGPISITGCKVVIGNNTFIGRNFKCEGNGIVTIGDNVDIAPNVTLLTGSHEIGFESRRAGRGITSNISIGNGTWVCANSCILCGIPARNVGNMSIIGCCSNVISDVPDNVLFCGNPAKVVKKYE